MKQKNELRLYQIKIAEYEVQFISATRHDSRADRSLCRGEMLELILRIAQIIYRQLKVSNRRQNRRQGMRMQSTT